ncbi:TetR/AcrR family transcriptional regulator [Catenulispora yoronensis]|uniref:TetR/AcrR family transcriptional regulator n=1 Tax=Catenulispora yoronensis TaxID=450799 RepID=A0ABN2V160_9ACTN
MSRVKSRREQYSEATRAALLEAAARRFAEHGFAGTALEDVAADIQATRGAVYHHFANKTALFRAVYEDVETTMLTRVKEAAAAHPDDVGAAADAALAMFLECCCEPVYGRLVWQEAPVALGWQEWKASEERYAFGMIEATVRTLIEVGKLPPLPVITFARTVFHLLGSAGIDLALTAEPDKARVKDEYLQVLRYMLGERPGPATP